MHFLLARQAPTPSAAAVSDYTGIAIYNRDDANLGKYQEVIIFSEDLSSNRSNIEDNINDFYSIYDKGSYRLLDYYSGAAVAYSLRRLLSTYTGSAIEVRRTEDDTTQDIGFTASGDLDTAALAAFCGSSDGFVKTWYDQSGNANNATQTSTPVQPKIYDSSNGVILDNNNNPTITFDNDKLALTTEIFLRANDPDEFLFSLVAESTEGAGAGEYFGGTTSSAINWFASYGTSNEFKIRHTNEGGTGNINASFAYPTPAPVAGEMSLLNFYAESSNKKMKLNGQSLTASGTTSWADGSAYQINFGVIGQAYASALNLNLSELVLWENQGSTDLGAIQDDINNHYSVYEKTKLLDFHPDAAAAYSLRKLMGQYSGSAIEVRRDGDNTTQDIGFDANGDLDTAALAAFCGSDNGFVETWYDQSLNGNDANQSTLANQPKIYDGTTGVVTENGKPAVKFDGTNTILVSASTYTPSSRFFMAQVLVASSNNISAAQQFVGDNDDRQHGMGLRLQSGDFNYYNGIESGFVSVGITADTNQNVHFWGRETSSSLYARLNGAQSSVSISAISTTPLNIYLGARHDNNVNFNGVMQEYILYLDNRADDSAAIEANVNRHYSIY